MERQLDSNTYRRVLEFAKINGTEPFSELIQQIDIFLHVSGPQIFDEKIFEKSDRISRILRKNSLVVNFLREFKNGFLQNTKSFGYSEKSVINGDKFRNLIKKVSECIERGSIDLAIENMRKLEELKIGVISLGCDYFPSQSFIATISDDKKLMHIKSRDGDIYFLDSEFTDIVKPFSDGTIRYSFIDENCDSLLGSGTLEDPYHFAKLEYYRTNFYNNTWIIWAENHTKYVDHRYIYIPNLDINLINLPTEEELSSYEIPKGLEQARKDAILVKTLPF